MGNRIAFIDETKGPSFILVAVVCETHELPGIRRKLNEMRLPGQRRIHMRSESQTRKRALVGQFLKFRLLVLSAETSIKNQPEARKFAMESLAQQLVDCDITNLVIELDETFERRDNQVLKIFSQSRGLAHFEYRHELASREPMLWAADIAAWAVRNGYVSR